ncbi:MAG: hypothetical protein AB3N21_15910 [Ruegeria sp.]|uniref:hypothetical protein n=1 Tax=Ruegeria sp. TaxID=1879320 RepID=UPI00349E5A12
MTKYAHYDATDGRILGFYDTSLHKVIPEPKIEIGDADWPGRFDKRVDVSGATPALYAYVPPPPSLDEQMASAVAEARQIAVDVRQQIAGAATVHRALAWAVKMPYAMVWAAHEAGGDPAGPFAQFAAVAEAGFQIEADVTGETAVAIRDRAIAKNRMFFQATQLVEGMERLAEDRIPAAADAAELSDIITQLRDLQAGAMSTLETLMEGGT